MLQLLFIYRMVWLGLFIHTIVLFSVVVIAHTISCSLLHSAADMVYDVSAACCVGLVA